MADGRRFYEGQPVVCVDVRWGPFWRSPWALGLVRPVLDGVYHVRSYIDGPPPLSLTVVEIKNPPVRWSDGVVRDIIEQAIKPRPRRPDDPVPWYEPQRKKETAE